MRADRSGTGPDGAHLWLTPNRGRQFYWLDLSRNWETGSKTRQITARIDRARNAVCVETDGDYVGILLNGRMLDLRSPVTVEVGQQKLTLRPQPNLKTLVATLADRGDPSYMFEVHIALKKADGKWTVR